MQNKYISETMFSCICLKFYQGKQKSASAPALFNLLLKGLKNKTLTI